MLQIKQLALIFLIAADCSASHRPFKADEAIAPINGPQFVDPLFLTPLIEAGQLDKARQLAKVPELPNSFPVDSYSGFLTINKQFNSNLFFWYFRNVS